MSYTIIKSIKIDNDSKKVFITGASNNVSPKCYYREESKYLSEILQEKGREEVELQIFIAYESGNLQRGTNKYTKALKVLHYVYGDEYNKFDWRNKNYDRAKELRKSPEFYELLRKALKTPLPKQKFIIYEYGYYNEGKKVYAKKRRGTIRWHYEKTKATNFDFQKEAENTIKDFYNSEDWKVEAL